LVSELWGTSIMNISVKLLTAMRQNPRDWQITQLQTVTR
jgi:hypothetical protein